jgi:hypothetical protein
MNTSANWYEWEGKVRMSFKNNEPLEFGNR